MIGTTSSRTLMVLAPSANTRAFSNDFRCEPGLYDHLIDEMQRLRGRVYLEDGAVRPSQLIDHKHYAPCDDDSWHLLLLDSTGRVCGCARYREYTSKTDFAELGVAKSALARCATWGPRLTSAVRSERSLASQLRVPYVELGGWALEADVRNTSEALRMALTTYALSRALGGGIGISTATKRHNSSSILRRLGGRSLKNEGAELPAYYDPVYDCEMEVLRFYSWNPNPRYESWIADVESQLESTMVLSRGTSVPRAFAAAAASGHYESSMAGMRLPVGAMMEPSRRASPNPAPGSSKPGTALVPVGLRPAAE